jgi:ABC-type sugar transport system permease subunit
MADDQPTTASILGVMAGQTGPGLSLSTTVSRAARVLAVGIVLFVALVARLGAIQLLPIDYDEDDYLRAGQQYAAAIHAGDWAAFTQENYRSEHPPLAKIAYGIALATQPQAPLVSDVSTSSPPAAFLPEPQFTVARLTAGLFGTLEVLLLAVLSPLAGLMLATGTWQITYTTEVMLEALPALTSALVALCYVAALRWPRHRRAWLVASAVAFGLTAAGKYLYCVVGIAVAIHWLWETRGRRESSGSGAGGVLAAYRGWLAPVAAWAALAFAVFVLADPYLWPDPVGRLWSSIAYHAGYAESQHVQEAGYPPWQPITWLFGSVPWHPGDYLISADLFVTLFGIAGLHRAWQRHRVFVIWLAIALLFLLLWPTKWPQYILILTFPLSLIAADGVHVSVLEPLARRWSALRATLATWRREAAWGAARGGTAWTWLRELRTATPWLLPGAIALAVLALFPLLFQVAMALTDFSAASIRDGMQGGVLRAAWDGVTGQVAAVDFNPFEQGTSAVVHWAGPNVLIQAFSGPAAPLLAFNVVWTVLAVALQVALGVGVALLLARRGIRFRGWWRALYIVPWAIPEFVGALAWRNILDPRFGVIALLAGHPIDWVSSAGNALLVCLVVATWGGWPLILLAAVAGLATIPQDVYDAAAIDGAGAWRRFRWVTWPMLVPVLLPAILVRTIAAFNQFYLFYVLGSTAPNGFPLSTLALTSFYVFDPTRGGLFALSAVINLLTVFMLVVIVARLFRWQAQSEGAAGYA